MKLGKGVNELCEEVTTTNDTFPLDLQRGCDSSFLGEIDT